MINVYNMLDHLLTNTNHTAKQAQKPKGQWNLIISIGKSEHF